MARDAGGARRLRKALPLLWLLTLAQAHARSATVFVDELDAVMARLFDDGILISEMG